MTMRESGKTGAWSSVQAATFMRSSSVPPEARQYVGLNRPPLRIDRPVVHHLRQRAARTVCEVSRTGHRKSRDVVVSYQPRAE